MLICIMIIVGILMYIFCNVFFVMVKRLYENYIDMC